MTNISRSFLAFYRKCENNPLVATVAHALWFGADWLKSIKDPAQDILPSNGRSSLRVAFICDQMTYDSFSSECSAVFLTPQNAIQTLRSFRPDFLFCESCWNGLQTRPNAWKRRIYRNHFVLFEHRKALLKILKECRRLAIPTVFWNKEDPTFYGNRQYDFVDTALHFDWIFTTAAECVERYHAAGHSNVRLLPFGFSPKLFNPLETGSSDKTAFFAGSWYQEQSERCHHLQRIFDALARHQIPFAIYDRFSSENDPRRMFPVELRPHVHPAIPFSQLSTVTRSRLFAVNINTVTSSETMFARRVFELMAENHILISNRSPGLEKLFPKRIWFYDEEPDFDALLNARRSNLEEVFLKHTNAKRFYEVASALGLEQKAGQDLCVRFQMGVPGTSVQMRYGICRSPWDSFELLPEGEEPLISPTHVAFISSFQEISQANWPFLFSQFSYLPSNCGIRWGNPCYQFITDCSHVNCLFSTEMAKDLCSSWLSPSLKFLV